MKLIARLRFSPISVFKKCMLVVGRPEGSIRKKKSPSLSKKNTRPGWLTRSLLLCQAPSSPVKINKELKAIVKNNN